MITLKLLERLNDSLKKETGEFITVNRVLLSEVYRELMVRMEAESKPVAVLDIQSNREDKPRLLMEYASAHELPDDTYQLFTAPPAPALPAELLDAMAEVIRISDRDHEAWDRAKAAISACRAAMLQPVSQGYKLPEDNETLCHLAESHGASIAWGFEEGEYQHILTFYPYQLRAMVIDVTGGKPVTGNSPVIPDGWKLVPMVELTEKMVIHGFESEAFEALADAVLDKKGWPYSCRESAECVTGIFKAMVEVAPSPGGADDSHTTAT